jgi:hypothetical protein
MKAPLARALGRAALAVLVALPGAASAQAAVSARVQPELRADAIFGSRPAVQAGAGLQLPVGYYVRVGADVAAGVRTGASSLSAGRSLDGRVDLLARFLLDPFRQAPYGVSAGAGLGARFEPGERVTPLLLVALDVEGLRGASGWTPALQVGLGGGARVGLVLRRGDPGAR